MKVQMLRTIQGSPDGIRAFTYREGEVYGPQTSPPMTQALARVLLSGDLAVEPDEVERKVVEPRENPPQFSPGDLTGVQVIEAVESGRIAPSYALELERQDRNRVTVVERLEAIIRRREAEG